MDLPRIIREFEQAWGREDALSLETVYARAGAADLGLLVELIRVDLEYRLAAGELGRVEEYLGRFPTLGQDREAVLELIEAEFQLRCLARDPNLPPDEYAQRFPDLWEVLRDRLVRFPPPPPRPSAARDAPTVVARNAPRHDAPTDDPCALTAFATGRQKPERMPSGSRIGDFELLDVLGEGACGFVYLARQTTLARFVALKVSNLVASESRTLAMLEHDHIVQVFSEAVDWQRGMRLLCMQLVPGTTLGKVIRYWQQSGSDFRQRSGAALLTAVESLSPDWLPIAQPSLRDRDQLMRSDPVDTVAWLGARLAEALEHAHGYQVLHRDVKPENILISRLGRPYLADFHLAGGQAPGDAAVVGGSPRYMAPEHLKAMAAGAHGEGTTVDQRADIYALGLVLFELLSMRLPVGEGLPARLTIPQLADLAAARQRPVVVQDLLPDAAREAMGPVLERCLDANPEQRYPRAADLAADLDAARQWNQMMHRLPSAGRLTHLVAHWPVLALICAAVLPNLLGSAVNILYNGLCILPRLAAADHPLFYRLVTSYNAVAYPLCLAILLWRSAPVIRQLRRTDRRAGDRGRRDAARLSTWVAGVSLLGWLPGAILFPLVLQITASNISRPTLGHLAVDFCISGLVAATYSYFLVEMIVLRVIYPRFLRGAHHPAQTAQIDLVGAQRRLYLGQTLAGVIPLTGAVLLMVAGPAESPTADSFRWLVCGLIGAGIVGFCLAVTLASRLVQMIGALTGR